MRRHGIVALVALASLAAGCGDSDGDAPQGATATAPAAAERLLVRVGDAPAVRAQVADDAAERAQGLSGRPRLARNAGMYFVLPDTTTRFWMKGMRFPLDMLWIRDDRVVDVTARAPKPRPGTAESRLPLYSSSRPADRVLEVNAGWAKRNGVQVGDSVRLGQPPRG